MPIGGPAFSSVRKAREALKERAHELLNKYISGLDMALARGDFETFQKGYQYLLDHMPEEEGIHIVDVSVDKKQIEGSKNNGPSIQIGVSIGGIKPAELPAVEVIELHATPVLPAKLESDDDSTD